MKSLTVLYDTQCELCCRARRWLGDQPAFLELDFVPAGSPEAARRFPELESGRTLREITVVADDGRVWRGDAAWITCLWALRRHRHRAQQLASPALRPLVRQFVQKVANQRHHISEWLAPRQKEVHVR